LLVIRLARTGKKKQAYFRIVVADKRRAVGAKFIEILGNYNPHAKKLELNEEKLAEYLKNGAQPSNTLAKILKKEGVKLPKWVYIVERKRPAKKVVEVAPEKKEVPTPEAAEAPAEEAKAEAPKEEPKTEEVAEVAEEPKEEPVATEAEPKEKEKDSDEAGEETASEDDKEKASNN
jgi:small subunit ribosomal protein S16